MKKKEIEIIIKYYAIENKEKFGKINPNAVLGRVLGYLDKESKKDIQSIRNKVNEICSAIQKLNESKIKKIKEGLDTPVLQSSNSKEKRTRGLKDLPNAVFGNVVTRTAPSPSGYLHIGHVFNIILNHEYAKKYKGKFILRIEDTNPDNIDHMAYKTIPHDVEWLIGERPEVVVQSKRMDIYYNYVEKLFKKGHAYVCKCKPEKFREFVKEKKACPHRDLSAEENLKEWEKMKKEYKEGDAVVRLKTDLEHPNPAIREFPIFRINTKEHPLQGRRYKVWPLMNFSVAVDDHELGITHVIRGKDHIINTERQKYIYDYLGWKYPEFIHLGRVNFTDFKISKSETKKKILEGIYSGWDDPRLPFLVAFRKRGFRAKAFKKYVLDMGVSNRDKKTSYKEFMKKLEHFNRQIIEPESNRYFFVENPVLLDIPFDEKEVEFRKHPDFDRGVRKLKFRGKIYISKEDYNKFKGKVVRLKNLCNIHLGNNIEVVSDNDVAKIVWLPEDQVIDSEIFMNDGSVKKGLIEKNVLDEKEGNNIQLEKMFFCRIDSFVKNKNIYKGVNLYYTHR